MSLFDGLPLSYRPKYLKDFSHRKKCKKEYTEKEAAVLAPQYLRQVEECTNLCNTTIKPDVYFTRYDTMISCLVELKKMQKHIKFKGKKPSKYLDEVLRTKDQQVIFFVTRIYQAASEKITSLSTTKSKENQIVKFIETINNIKCEIPASFMPETEKMISNLRNMIK